MTALDAAQHPLNFPGIVPVLLRRPPSQDPAAPGADTGRHFQPRVPTEGQPENAPRQPVRNLGSRVMPFATPDAGPDAGPEAAEFTGRPSARGATAAPAIHRSSSASDSRRPSTAPGNKQNNPGAPQINGGGANTTDDDDESRVVLRPPKPPLRRSQSEYASPNRHDDEGDHADEEHHEWGARHGFEDHYQSEDIISQLANVSWILWLCQPESCHLFYGGYQDVADTEGKSYFQTTSLPGFRS